VILFDTIEASLMTRLLNLLLMLGMLLWALTQLFFLFRTKQHHILIIVAAMLIAGVVASLYDFRGSTVVVLIALGAIALVVVRANQS